jgi:oxygen-independent coproporphyrinogen-3 oxidase
MNEIRFDTDLIERYGGRGPRYTSYPTAVQFHQGFGETEYRRQCAASNEGPDRRPLSIYVHLPFCESLCYYCACNKEVTRNRARVERYMTHLYTELDMQATLFDDERVVEQLHLGGGSPTYFSTDELGELIRRIGERFRLQADGNQEFSIEVDPRTIGPEGMAPLNELGFNRLSLGVQDLEARVQEAVNRVQSFEKTRDLIDAARASGFQSVSLDLIYGLPHQTVASFDATIDRVLSLRPDRLAIYNYAHLPEMFKAQRLIDAADLPDASEKLEILHRTISKLTDAGYEYIGMDHFALPADELVLAQRKGELQRNFQGYSTHARCDLISLGVSAISHVHHCYSQNVKSVNRYCQLLEQGRLPVERGLELSDDDELRATVIETIMCHGRLQFGEVERQFGIDFDKYFADEVEALVPLERDGLVRLGPGGLEVTPAGRLLLRPVAMVFDRYLREQASKTRFSKVI